MKGTEWHLAFPPLQVSLPSLGMALYPSRSAANLVWEALAPWGDKKALEQPDPLYAPPFPSNLSRHSTQTQRWGREEAGIFQ